MNYEIQNELRRKAEDWEVQNLKNEISHLKQDISDLESKNNYWQGRFNNLSRAMEEVINLLLYNNFDDNILNQTKQYLY